MPTKKSNSKEAKKQSYLIYNMDKDEIVYAADCYTKEEFIGCLKQDWNEFDLDTEYEVFIKVGDLSFTPTVTWEDIP